MVKNSQSCLREAVPKTWDLEISFADELDEMWGDELWDLGAAMDEQAGEQGGMQKSWWILKPGMADRGMGIRMFDSKEALQGIFEAFEEDEDDELEEDESDTEQGRDEETRDNTAVVISQLRHFVIQVKNSAKSISISFLHLIPYSRNISTHLCSLIPGKCRSIILLREVHQTSKATKFVLSPNSLSRIDPLTIKL